MNRRPHGTRRKELLSELDAGTVQLVIPATLPAVKEEPETPAPAEAQPQPRHYRSLALQINLSEPVAWGLKGLDSGSDRLAEAHHVRREPASIHLHHPFSVRF
jgi:hypothetical protein